MDMFLNLIQERLQQVKRNPQNTDIVYLSLLLRSALQYFPDNTEYLNTLARVMHANNMSWECYKLARHSHEINGNADAAEILRQIEYPPFPVNVTFEIATICNLRCPLCEYGTGNLNRPQKLMTFEQFERAWTMLAPTTQRLTMVGYGESFLNPDIYRMLDLVPEQVYVYIDTNGNVDLNCEQIIKKGVNEIVFAVDGINQEMYEQYRVGGNLDRVLTNIRTLINTKQRLGRSNPFVTFKFILFKHTEMYVDQALAMARQLGVDRVRVEPCHTYPHFGKDNIDRFAPVHTKQRIRYVDFEHHEICPTADRLAFHCTVPYTRTVITIDGDVIPCCSGKVENIIFGNVFEHSFIDIWHSETARNFRRKVLKNRWQVPGCRVCSESLFHFGKFLDGTCLADEPVVIPDRPTQWHLSQRRVSKEEIHALLESGRKQEADYFIRNNKVEN